MRRRIARVRTSLRDSQDERRRSASWASVGDDVTVFDIAGGRGYIHALAVLAGDFPGTFGTRRLGALPASSPPRPTRRASPMMRRCRDMIGDARAGAAASPTSSLASTA